MEILKVNKISVSFGKSIVIKDVSFSINKGEIILLIGGNGSGKTTILKTIIGIFSPNKGDLIYKGISINNKKTYQRVRSGMSFVYQERRIFSSCTVEENLLLSSFKKKNLQNRLEKVYNYFPILKNKYNHTAANLSGGEQQALAIGRALIQEPTLIILDEPFAGLTPNAIHHILSVIKDLSKKGTSFLIVEHRISEVYRYTDYIIGLKRGELMFSKKTDSIENKNEFIKTLLTLVK